LKGRKNIMDGRIGTIPGKSRERERVRLYASFKTQKYRASTITRAKNKNASMTRVTGLEGYLSDVQ
jgi:hypothetical protein